MNKISISMQHIALMLASLSDDELTNLTTMVYDEKDNRIVADINNGKYPPLNDEEYAMMNTTTRISIMVAYKERTGVPVYVSKKIVEMAIEEQKQYRTSYCQFNSV